MKKIIFTLLITLSSIAQAQISFDGVAIQSACSADPILSSYRTNAAPKTGCASVPEPAFLTDLQGLDNKLTHTYLKALENVRVSLLNEIKNDPEFRKSIIKALRAE